MVMDCDRCMNMEEFTKCPACLQGQAQEHEGNEQLLGHAWDYRLRDGLLQCRGERACNSVIRNLWCGPGTTINYVAALLAVERKGQHA